MSISLDAKTGSITFDDHKYEYWPLDDITAFEAAVIMKHLACFISGSNYETMAKLITEQYYEGHLMLRHFRKIN